MRTSTGAASSTVIVIEYSAFPPSPSSMISESSWSPAGSLASINPRILSAIAGKGAALAGPLSGGLGLGALGGMNFDIASSLNFVNSITKIFNCDPDPEC